MLLIPANNGFWYDHGIEILAAIATFGAVAVALGTTLYTANKDRKNKEEYNTKTLYMTDLKTLENRERIREEYVKLKTSARNVVMYSATDNTRFKNELFTPLDLRKHPNVQKDAKELKRKHSYLKYDKLNKLNNRNLEILENILYSYYTNLDFDGIRIVESKINLSYKLRDILNKLEVYPSKEILNRSHNFDEARIKRVYIALDYFTELENILLQLSEKITSDNLSNKYKQYIETDNKEDKNNELADIF
ncbi:hypothetical protein [Mammaliicoccus sp. JADD-157]|uniref:hypothetical protein n=1 Tax=Mammaliicoccus sp. JADD-157 TaxID=3404818 RepID=UPI003BB67C04